MAKQASAKKRAARKTEDFLKLYRTAAEDEALRLELRGWAILTALCLGVGGGIALILALARAPMIGEALDLSRNTFAKLGVVHVNLAFFVSLLTTVAMLNLLATARDAGGNPKAYWLGPVGLGASVLGALQLLFPALADGATAYFNNYIPVIVSPTYYAGLFLIAFGVLLTVLRLWITVCPKIFRADGLAFGLGTGGMVLLIAVFAIAEAAWSLNFQIKNEGDNDLLFWAGGHTLQFLNTILILSAWAIMGHIYFRRPMAGPNAYKAAMVIILLGAAAGLWFMANFDVNDGRFLIAFTHLKFTLGIPVLIFWASAAHRFSRHGFGRWEWGNPVFLALFFSLLIFTVGGIMGFFVEGVSTRTPAHYHTVIAAIIVAMAGLVLGFILPLLDRPVHSRKLMLIQLWLLGLGPLIFSTGMFWAGSLGISRKVQGADQLLDTVGAQTAMGLTGIGAVIAIIGGTLFIVTFLYNIMRAHDTPRRKR